MDLYEATAILKAVKTFEDIDGRGEAYAKAEAAEELAEIVRTFVEDAAELGGFYTDLMCAVGEGDEVGIGADDPLCRLPGGAIPHPSGARGRALRRE